MKSPYHILYTYTRLFLERLLGKRITTTIMELSWQKLAGPTESCLLRYIDTFFFFGLSYGGMGVWC